jgi:hypothetical protein
MAAPAGVAAGGSNSPRRFVVPTPPPSAPTFFSATDGAEILLISAEGPPAANGGQPPSAKQAADDWSVGNESYPKLRRPTSAAAPLPAARRRYALPPGGAVALRRAARPSSQPVRVKGLWVWENGQCVPIAATTPSAARGGGGSGGASTAAAAADAADHGGTVRFLLAGGHTESTASAGVGEGGAPLPAADEGGAGAMGLLTGMLAKKDGVKPKSARISLRTAALLTRNLTAGQARAKTKEKERLQAEREAHYASLKTALGTEIDIATPGGISTAAAIEATMEEELLRAIPPPRERSPQQLGRGLERLEADLHRQIIASPRDRRATRKPYMRETSSRRDIHLRGEKDSSMRSDTLTPRDRLARQGSSRSSVHGLKASSSHAPPTSAKGGAAGVVTPRPHAPPGSIESHTSQRGLLLASGRAATVIGKAVRPMDDELELEALPMPLPRSSARRHRTPRHAAATQHSTLECAQEHTPQLQEALAMTGHLLKRASLRRLIARILEDPTMLPEGVLEFDNELDDEQQPAVGDDASD